MVKLLILWTAKTGEIRNGNENIRLMQAVIFPKKNESIETC